MEALYNKIHPPEREICRQRERIFTSIKRATFHTHLNPKGTVSGDGFTLRLGHSGKEGGQHLAGHFRGINMFFFKGDSNPQRLQFPLLGKG